MEKPAKGWKAVRKESFARLVFYRGLLQFGLTAAVLFILLSAIRGDGSLYEHALRALVAFPLLGLIFGAILWVFSRLFGGGGPEQTTNKS